MEVILTQDVDKLGKAGAVIKAKDGFARNFLIPSKLAVPMTPQNLKRLERDRQKKSAELEKAMKAAEALKARLEGISLTISALIHEDEKLYGSIGAQEISSALKDEGLEIDKNFILLPDPIKALGIYEVPVNLHPEVTAKIKVWIVKK